MRYLQFVSTLNSSYNAFVRFGIELASILVIKVVLHCVDVTVIYYAVSHTRRWFKYHMSKYVQKKMTYISLI